MSRRKLREYSVALVTGSHVCNNPRAVKEATTLAEAGFHVEVFGAWLDREAKARDLKMLADVSWRFSPVLDVTKSETRRVGYRVATKVGRLAFRYGGLANRWQLGYTVSALRAAVSSSHADLFIAHSEAGLAAVSGVVGAGRRVGVDMEDWFSEDLLPEARRERPLRWLRRLEGQVLRSSAHSSCPSRAMSNALAAEYSCQPPVVLYNAFPWSDRQELDGVVKDRIDPRLPSIHWYSQTLGPGRGLEELTTALPHMKQQAEIHLRGNPAAGFVESLLANAPAAWRGRIAVHGVVSNAELLSRIAEHDIGFAGELRYCRSRDLTVTNKILQYLLAGVSVVASDTAGQREIALAAPGAVFLYPGGNPIELAAQLDRLLASREQMNAAKTAALRAAETSFCWEKYADGLVGSVERGLAAAAGRTGVSRQQPPDPRRLAHWPSARVRKRTSA